MPHECYKLKENKVVSQLFCGQLKKLKYISNFVTLLN